MSHGPRLTQIVFTVLHNSRLGGYALVSLSLISFDCEDPHVNLIIKGVECCGLSLPLPWCTRLLIFILKAENSTSLSSCSQSLHFEQIDNADPHLNNGTNVGALSSIEQPFLYKLLERHKWSNKRRSE